MRLMTWIIIVILSTVFAIESNATELLIGIDTRHYGNNTLVNNNNYILGLKFENITIMTMNNSNSKDSLGIVYTNKISDNLSYGIGAFSGYDNYIYFGTNEYYTKNILINNNILVMPLLFYNKNICSDIDLNFVFTPTNLSTIISIKLK